MFEHLDSKYKEERRAEWLKEHYSKQAKRPNTKEKEA